ncbi:MAG: GNAT family N-acetyltransferase [Chloroflexi bacterium]|nr:GNAT family N-acetyltransferase [Chloroflexota bacterium]MCY3696330.1 GNAT family N-acetyltransferase [Chloroflexota bacterium]
MAEQVLNGTPSLHLRTLYLFDAAGRTESTLEPQPTDGPSFTMIRSRAERVWAVGARVAPGLAEQLDLLAGREPPLEEWRDPPRFAERYRALLGGVLVSGPALEFPDRIDAPEGVILIDDVRVLQRHFPGWTAEEISGRTPMAAVMVDGHAVSLCACARRTGEAAEASLETAEPFRGQGLAERVTAAWAIAVRESGRTPLYSTSWENTASLAVARKLGLTTYAASWSLYQK